MNVIGALLLFIVFIVVYIVIAEIFTVLFRLTGLTDEKARFQVISMLTNSGFTTSESELITSSRKRRRLCRITMLFGYSFTVTIVSTVVNFFIALTKSELDNMWAVAAILIGVFVIAYFLRKVHFIRHSFDRCIEWIGNKVMFGKSSNAIVVLDTYGSNVMAEINLTHLPKELDNVPLINAGLKEKYGVQLLLIKRKSELVSVINGDTIICEGDVVVVFGMFKNIRILFEKPEA